MKSAKTPKTVLISRLYEFKILRINYLLKVLMFVIAICAVPIIFTLFFGNFKIDNRKNEIHLEYKNRKILSYIKDKSEEKEIYFNFDDNKDLNISLSEITNIDFEEKINKYEDEKRKLFYSKKNTSLLSLKLYNKKIIEYDKLQNFIEKFENERKKKQNHLEMQKCKQGLNQKMDELLEIISKMEKSKIEVRKKERELQEIESKICISYHKIILLVDELKLYENNDFFKIKKYREESQNLKNNVDFIKDEMHKLSEIKQKM